jgi:hypothetical protein
VPRRISGKRKEQWMKRLKSLLLFCLLALFFAATAGADLVTIRNKGSYWRVRLDYSGGISAYEMGIAYGRALDAHLPGIRARIDRYLAERLPQGYAELCISRFSSLDVPEAYVQELNGICDALELTDETELGDGELSRVEFFLHNYLFDVASPTECAGLAVWGGHTAEGGVLVGRNLDLETDSRPLFSRQNAVVFVNKGKQSYCRIGYASLLPVFTAFRPNGLFAAAINSGLTRPKALPEDPPNPIAVPARYREERSSWLYSLRYAVEHYDTAEAVARYMTSRDFHWNHNILIADKRHAVVVENNISGPAGWQGRQLVRTVRTELNYGVEPWDIGDSISVVNSFIAKGNYDNHTNALRNARRRHNQLNLLRRRSADGKVSLSDMIAMQSWYRGDAPGPVFSGDIFNHDWRVYTAQSMVFVPAALELRIFFDTGTPAAGLPKNPVYESVPVEF